DLRPEPLGAFENGPAKRPLGLVADKEQHGIGIGQAADEMMQDASAIEHSGSRQYNRRPADMVEPLGFVGGARELHRWPFDRAAFGVAELFHLEVMLGR